MYSPSLLYEKTVFALHVYSSAEVEEGFACIIHVCSQTIKLTLVKIICICACYLHKFTI